MVRLAWSGWHGSTGMVRPHWFFVRLQRLAHQAWGSDHISLSAWHKTVVDFHADSPARPRRSGSRGAIGLRYDLSVRRLFFHGRPGFGCLFFGFSAVDLSLSHRRQASGRPRRLGSHRLWYLGSGSVRGPGIFLFGLHRALIECPRGTSGRPRPRSRVEVHLKVFGLLNTSCCPPSRPVGTCYNERP